MTIADNNLHFSLIKEDNTIGKSGIVMLDNTKKVAVWASIPLCKNVVIPNDISIIACDGFCRCRNMETITCNGIELLNYQSFSDCYKLNSIHCHNVKNIVSLAFRNTGIECQNVNVYMTEIDEPPECEADAFKDESSITRANPICILVKDDEVVQKFIDNQTWKKFIDDGKITVLKYVPA